MTTEKNRKLNSDDIKKIINDLFNINNKKIDSPNTHLFKEYIKFKYKELISELDGSEERILEAITTKLMKDDTMKHFIQELKILQEYYLKRNKLYNIERIYALLPNYF